MGKVQDKKEVLIKKLSEEMEINGGIMRTSQLYELPMDFRKIQQFVEVFCVWKRHCFTGVI